MKKLCLLFALLITAAAGVAQSPETLFEEGNEHYRNEEYNEAIESYKRVLQSGYESATLHFNLGNAYYKTNQLGRAILHYEKAAQLEPYDADIQQNLNIAHQATIDKFEEMPEPIFRAFYLSVLKALSPGGWAVVAVVGLFIFLLGSFMYFFTTYNRPGFSIAAAGLVLGLICLALAYAHQNYLEEHTPAIVMSTSSYVKSGPGEKAEDVFILHEGARVIITEEYENWRKIQLPDGKVGWIDADDLARI